MGIYTYYVVAGISLYGKRRATSIKHFEVQDDTACFTLLDNKFCCMPLYFTNIKTGYTIMVRL